MAMNVYNDRNIAHVDVRQFYKLTSEEQLVFVWLTYYADIDQSTPRLEVLSRQSKLPKTIVERAILSLQDKGLYNIIL